MAITFIGITYVFGVLLGVKLAGTQNYSADTSFRSTTSTTRRTSSSDTPSPTPQLEAAVSFSIPESKNLPGGSHTFQTFNNCGPAALSMTLSHYNISVSQQELGNALRPFQNPQGNNDDKSVTLAEVAAKGEEYGLTAYVRPAGNMELIEMFIAQDIPVIARTWLEVGEDIGHYRVVTGYNQTTQTIIQDDSLQGKQLEYSYSDFNDLWRAFNYEFVVLVPQEKIHIAEQILGDLVNEKMAWQQALELAEAELQKNPQALYPAFNKSVALFHMGQFDESIRVYESIENQLPSRMLWYQLEPLLAYYAAGDFETVLQKSQEIINNANRAYSELYYLRGLVYQQQNQPNNAEEQFSLANQYNTSEFWKENIPW